MEFNSNFFSNDTNSQASGGNSSLSKIFSSKNTGFILGALALIIAFLCCGTLISLGILSDLFIYSLGMYGIRFILFMFMMYFIISSISVTLGIISIINLKKQENKLPLNTLGFAFSIISFVVCGVTFILNICIFTVM